MTQEERYCSYEVARLLREKGFKQTDVIGLFTTKAIYRISADSNGKHGVIYCYPEWVYNKNKYIAAPTQQMACDWLHTKGVLITYDLSSPFGSKLVVKVYRKDYDLDWVEATTIIRETLEEAINDALKYSLENLV